MGVRIGAVMTVAAAALLVSACSSPSGPGSDPSSNAPDDQSASPSASATPEPRAFTMPTECAELLPTSRTATFEAEGMLLLGGPGGLYGNDYLLEPTPEEAAGGITCIWGDEEVPSSTVTVSIAPLNAENRARIVEDLIAQGLNQEDVDGTHVFARVGDEVSASPAWVNVLRGKTWISVIEGIGGQAFLEEAVEIATEVAEHTAAS